MDIVNSVEKMMIVFSGYNQRAVISFLRVLERNNISDYCIVAIENDDILKTKYADKVVKVRRTIKLDKDYMLFLFKEIRECTGAKSLVVVPSTEGMIRFMLKYRDDFYRIGCSIPVVENKLYEMISDKQPFYTLCRENGIKVPEQYDFPKEFNKKYVAKTRCYTSKGGKKLVPILVLSRDDHELFVRNGDRDCYFCEEYIDGESFYLLFYITKNGEIIKFSQKNYIQQLSGGSIIASDCADIHNSAIAEKYSSLLINVGFWGLIMIELRMKDNDYYMIEANPRLWGPVQLTIDANVPIIEAFLWDSGFIDDIPDYEIDMSAKYYWSTGIGEPKFNIHNCCMHRGYEAFLDHIAEYRKYDLYDRDDTRDIFLKEAALKYGKTLRELYESTGKHSCYQQLNDEMEVVIGTVNHDKKHLRYEKERWQYISKHLDINECRVADVGGNTGYFTFECSKCGALSVDYFEGNKPHAEFVKIAKDIYNGRINVFEEYFDFEKDRDRYDVILCMNVIHHLGDDFLETDTIESAKKSMISCINAMSSYCDTLVFQIGFNWKGDITKGLFSGGTKEEMIRFITENTKEYWNIVNVGVAVDDGTSVVYEELNDINIKRNDALGEFLNRPLFLMKTR